MKSMDNETNNEISFETWILTSGLTKMSRSTSNPFNCYIVPHRTYNIICMTSVDDDGVVYECWCSPWRCSIALTLILNQACRGWISSLSISIYAFTTFEGISLMLMWLWLHVWLIYNMQEHASLMCDVRLQHITIDYQHIQQLHVYDLMSGAALELMGYLSVIDPFRFYVVRTSQSHNESVRKPSDKIKSLLK